MPVPIHPVIVVGGGLAGLAVSLELARAGLPPLLLEAGPTLGGRAATDRTADGHRFDRGAHALFRAGCLEAFLRRHGVHVAGPVATTTGSVVCTGGRLRPLPGTALELLRAGWLDRVAFGRWFGATQLGRLPAEGTAADWLRDALPSGPARDMATALTRVSVYGGDLDRLDAAVASAQVRVGFGGVRYLQGGWQSLVDKLAAAATAAGARHEVRRAVRAVQPTDDGVVLETAEGPLHAARVVLAVPPDRARAMLGQGKGDEAGAVRVAAVQLALAPEVIEGPCRRLAFDLDRPVFVSNFSSVVSYSDDDSQVVHAIRYLDDGDDPRTARQDIDATLDQIYPRWRQGLRAERTLPRIATTSVRPEPGSTRPQEQVHDRVWCAGDGYGPGALLADAAIASAERVSQALVAGTR